MLWFNEITFEHKSGYTHIHFYYILSIKIYIIRISKVFAIILNKNNSLSLSDSKITSI
ncbi:hypothetical protein ACIN8IBEIGE_210167 [Acinetobacter sp. 8I-beige]|nr:hypothetical protein ACIN8IBEIGE_210167 [Acinetobacter sp. 8I-beige]